MEVKEILNHHKKFETEIKNRLNEFSNVGKDRNEIFRELCYCILTAGASAELGLKTITHLGDVIFDGTEEEIVAKLKEIYRFYNIRGNYIFIARNNFKKINIDDENVRNDLVENIKGIAMKESSHFLRNIGKKGYAILDKHIINCLFELNVLDSNKPPKNKKEYLEIENKMKDFSKEIGIDFDELDLVLWSFKTGKVLK